MQRITTLIILLLIATICQAGPALELEMTRFDFGQVTARSPLYHHVWFKSTGDDTLRIHSIKTHCDCSSMPLPDDVLAPGDSMQVTFIWSSTRRHGPDRQFPRIMTNASRDPYRLEYAATFMNFADSARPVACKPYRFEFVEMPGLIRDSISFTLENRDDQGWTALCVTAPSEDWEIVIPDSLPPSGKATGYIKLTEKAHDKEFEDTITLQFDNLESDPTRISVPIRHKLLGK